MSSAAFGYHVAPASNKRGRAAAFAKAIIPFLALASASPIAAGAVARSSLQSAKSYTVSLTGRAEVTTTHPTGGTGDMNGSGRVKITIDPDKQQICYDFTLSGVSTPLMAHIHEGPAFRNGPTAVTLFTGSGENMSNCVRWTQKQLAEIVVRPSDYYVNLYTTEFPDGALRGQLRS